MEQKGIRNQLTFMNDAGNYGYNNIADFKFNSKSILPYVSFLIAKDTTSLSNSGVEYPVGTKVQSSVVTFNYIEFPISTSERNN